MHQPPDKEAQRNRSSTGSTGMARVLFHRWGIKAVVISEISVCWSVRELDG